MTITWGTCGHPVRNDFCTVCWLVGYTSQEVRWDDEETRGTAEWPHDPALVNHHGHSHAWWEVTSGKWRGREDEANAPEFTADPPTARPANNAQHDLVICLSGQVARDAIGWSSRDVPFHAPRYDPVTGKPTRPYMRPAAIPDGAVGTLFGVPLYYAERLPAGVDAAILTATTESEALAWAFANRDTMPSAIAMPRDACVALRDDILARQMDLQWSE